MTTAEDIAKNIVFDKIKDNNIISYSILNNANGDEWKEIKLVFNGSKSNYVVKIPRGEWTIIAADGEINPDGLGSTRGGSIAVTPTSALILARIK